MYAYRNIDDFALRSSYEGVFNLRTHHVSCRGSLSHKQDAHAIKLPGQLPC